MRVGSTPAASIASRCGASVWYRPTWRHEHSQSASRHRKSLKEEEAHPASWRSIPQRVFWRIAAMIGRSGAAAKPAVGAANHPLIALPLSVSLIVRRDLRSRVRLNDRAPNLK